MIIDFADINTLNALYISISIGISLKFLWAWKVKYSFTDSISDSANTKIVRPLSFYRKKCRLNQNFILIRIVKHIRKKQYSKEDTEGPISFQFI